MRIIVRKLTEQRVVNPKLPNLRALPGALDKLYDAIEGDAREMLDGIEAAHQHRKTTRERAQGKIAGARESLGEINEFLDKVDAAIGDNGGPTLDGSSESSGDAPRKD